MSVIFPNWDKRSCKTDLKWRRPKPIFDEIKDKTIYNFCSCSLLPAKNIQPRKESWDQMKLIYSDKRVNIYESHPCFLCKLPVIHILEEELAMFASLHVIDKIQRTKKASN